MTHSFLRPTESEIYALTHRDIAIADNPKRLTITIRKGKTGYRISNTMPAAVTVYNRIKSRHEAHTQDDFLFLPFYKKRSSAKRIIQRQFNALIRKMPFEARPLHKYGSHSLFTSSHCHLYADYSVKRSGQYIQPRQERRNIRGSDRTFLCPQSAALKGNGDQFAKLWGIENRLLATTVSATMYLLVREEFRSAL